MTSHSGADDDEDAVTIDRLVPEDWETLRAVRLRALEESPHAFASTLDRELAFDEATWRSRCVTSAQFVARAGGAVCGLAAAFEVRPGAPPEHGRPGWHLLSMWVAPGARRKGVGAGLVDCVLSYAREHEAESVELWAADDNLGAVRFYESVGFRRTGLTQPLWTRPSVQEQEFTRRLD